MQKAMDIAELERVIVEMVERGNRGFTILV